MTVGKDPHRPEGKKGEDARHNRNILAGETPRSNTKTYERDLAQMRQGKGGPAEYEAEEQVGGSRPGTDSRVKDAITRREEREEQEGG